MCTCLPPLGPSPRGRPPRGPSSRAFSSVCFRWLLALLAVGLLGGCGEDTPPPAPPGSVAPAPAPTVKSYTAAEKVAYALERLERGPAPLNGLVLKDVHRRNLELATADMLFYEAETHALLSDPALIARITGNVDRYGDAWHNILRLLISFRTPAPALMASWTRPVTTLPLREDLDTLRVEAARGLSLAPSPGTADVLLALFETAPAHREIGHLALSALMRQPAHRERALALALREGPGALWQSAPARIAGAMPEGEVNPEVAGALAWWHALTVGSAPRMDTTLPHLKSQPWTQARLGVDDSVPPRVTRPGGAPLLRYGSLPSAISFGSGWYGTSLVREPVLPAHAMVFTGKLPGAEARCILGQLGFPGYAAAVTADLALESVDEGLYFTAKHCMLDASPASDAEVQAQVSAMLDAGGPWDVSRVRRLQRLVGAIGSCDDPAVWNQLSRILHEVRPLDVARPLLEQAYDTMYQRENDLRVLVAGMLEGGMPEDAGVALHMIRRTRDPQYLDALERELERATTPERARLLQRTLTFIYSRGREVEPSRLADFVKRYEGWLEREDPQRFRTMATGLLDFGDDGAAAFARALSGPRRHLLIQAWPRDRRLVPLVVAEAALAPLGRDTPPKELNHVLGLAWSSFPESAGPALEALRRRVRSAQKPAVAAALRRVLHRAPRHGDNH